MIIKTPEKFRGQNEGDMTGGRRERVISDAPPVKGAPRVDSQQQACSVRPSRRILKFRGENYRLVVHDHQAVT